MSVPVQRDARGISYVVDPQGRRQYLMPDTRRIENRRVVSDAPQDSFFSNYDWDPRTGTFARSTNWNNVIGAGTLAAIAAPVAYAAATGTLAGTPAAGSVLPSSSIAGMHTAVPAAITSQGVSASVPGSALASGLASAGVPAMPWTIPAGADYGTLSSAGLGGYAAPGSRAATSLGSGSSFGSQDISRTVTQGGGMPGFLGGSWWDWARLGASGGMELLGNRQQAGANRDLLAFYERQAAEDKRRYDEMVAQQRAQYEATEARRAPYRAAALNALQTFQPMTYTPPPMTLAEIYKQQGRG